MDKSSLQIKLSQQYVIIMYIVQYFCCKTLNTGGRAGGLAKYTHFAALPQLKKLVYLQSIVL